MPTSANAQPALGLYEWSAEADAFVPHAITVLGLDGGQIADVTIFRTAESLAWLGLPAEIAE